MLCATGLACGLGLWGGVVMAGPGLLCELSYAGATQTVWTEPVQAPYTVSAIDLFGRFRFKPVVVGTGEQIERIDLYAHVQTPAQPVIIQHAHYRPPQGWQQAGRPLALTGEQHLYAGPMARELIYQCSLHTEKP